MPNLIKICSPIQMSLERGTHVKEDIMHYFHKEISNDIALGNKMIGRYVLEPLDVYVRQKTGCST
jgi:hypothetical protein